MAKDQFQEMVEWVSAHMTEASEEITKKTLEVLEKHGNRGAQRMHPRFETSAQGMPRFNSRSL